MDVRAEPWRELSMEELILLNYGVAKTLESPLDCKDNQPVHPKGNQSWIFIGRTDAEAEAPILWPPDAGKDWEQEEKRMTEDEMVGWYHRLNGHEFEQATGDGEGQGSLACCSPGSRKELHKTEQPDKNNNNIFV